MAITVIIEPTESHVSGIETQFKASGPFVLYGDGFAEGEWCSLDRLGPSGTYIRACNEKGVIKLGANPNMIYVEAPGSYRLRKGRTSIPASVGIQSSYTVELFVNTDEHLELRMLELIADNTSIWYDPQDLTTMYQDPQGTLPVYRPGTGLVDPPVGLMLDKSQGLELGPELWDGQLEIYNGAGLQVGAYNQRTGELSVTTAGAVNYSPRFYGPELKNKQLYQVSVRFYGNTSKLNGIFLTKERVSSLFEYGGISGAIIVANGNEYTYIGGSFSPNETDTPQFSIAVDGSSVWSGLIIESISIREIKGYHAYQPTTTARPTLSGRYNLLTATETLTTQNVTTVATDYTLSFSGEGTVTLSGAATGTYSAGTHTITCTAGTLTCTVDGSVTEADLRVKRDGSDLPAYQAVVNANNYDTDGFPLFLKRDMVDDNMICQVPEGGITGTFSIGTVDGPIFGTRALPAREAYPLWNNEPTYGPSTYTQLIHLNTVLDSDDQELFERFVYSKVKQLIDVDQFGGVSSFSNFFRNTLTYGNEINLLTLDVSNFDTRNARNFSVMFYDNTNLVISNIDALEVTSKVTSINGMFVRNRRLTAIDISGWDLSNVTNATNLFNGCAGLANVVVGTAFDNCPCTSFINSFTNTNLSQASIDKILISINKAGTSNGTFNQSGGSSPSAAGEAAITAMRSRGWTVTVTGGFAGDLVFSFGLDNVDSFSFTLKTKTNTAPVLVDWGDGTQSTHVGTTEQTASHIYAVSGTYAVKVYGVYGADQSTLTEFSTTANGMSGALVMPSGMTSFRCFGQNTLTGTLSLPSGMTYFHCAGQNTLSGTLSIPSGMTYFHCAGSNTLSGYTPAAKASDQQRFRLAGLNTMSATDVDNILIDYDAAGGTWNLQKEITIQGNAADRTSASDAAYTSLETKLDTLDVD